MAILVLFLTIGMTMFYSILFSCILAFSTALSAGEFLAVVAPDVNVTPKSGDSSSDECDSSGAGADLSGTGEVGDDIIIDDEIDTNDDEGVSS